MADQRRLAVLTVGVLAVPAAIALTDAHLATGPASLVISTLAATLAVSALALQPLLAALLNVRLRWHRVLGTATFALVLIHVGGLYIVSAQDTLFALSPDGPTRARMALMATIALAVVVFLGAGRARLPLSTTTWRVLHAFFAVLVVVLGVGHAVLTDGALDGAGTPVLLACGIAALGGIAYAAIRRARRLPSGPRRGITPD
jgi:predicted ferric reductase